ncbi:SDR family oxidoreductase [Sabulicella glaciei]|uniref:SDR family oxidoreductase n=1 Tax=Sabulicella glaciei TaxID=2984948 RepID=A0ABT3NUI2_9PROT|nr:SDR family oxidoreductase [Roseococcus sp. MDT2-1-1]MCW8085821.1 SDR family oxidoreductase [Roseococcus sp. MDT2-1-1]
MPHFKPLSRQVIVLTGASSGIGLATARMAAEQGARLILVARNREALETLAEELRAKGTEAQALAGDVTDPATHERAAALALQHFGQIDSWVNDAGAFIYGRVDETPIEDQRRLFDVVYWGTLHGSLVALRHLQDRGGALVNIGSVLGERAIALQGPYSAAKFAVKAITDTLRMEARMAGSKASVTLIKPGPIDTPYMEHARNLTGAPGTRNPPPAYHPRVVARAILHACTHPVRDLTVGGGGAAMAWMGKLFPALTDMAMVAMARPVQESDDPGRAARRDNLYQPKEDLAETSSLSGPAPRRSSLLLEMQMNPLAVATAGVAGAAALLLFQQSRRGSTGRGWRRTAPRRMGSAAE